MIRTSLAIGAVVATLASLTTAADGAGAAIRFSTVAQGHGSSSTLRTPGVDVVTSRREWRANWRKLNVGDDPGPALPRVDFSRHMLLLVTAGGRPTGGYGVTVTAVTRPERRLRVTAEVRAPGSGCFVTQAQTAPYHVVRVRRIRGGATLTRRFKTIDC